MVSLIPFEFLEVQKDQAVQGSIWRASETNAKVKCLADTLYSWKRSVNSSIVVY